MIKLFPVQNLKTIFRTFRISCPSALPNKQNRSPFKIVCTGKKPFIEFDCKVALITGGSDGIGLAIAHELLSENLRNVALVGINTRRGREAVQSLNSTYGKSKAIFVNCDVQSKVEVQDCYCKVIKEFGKIDIVVNAAGVFDGCNWEKEIMTNLVGTINNILEAYKLMSKEENGCGGVVLNFSGLHGLKPFYAAPTLSATFHGVIGLSRSFGHEVNFKNTSVRVVTLCTGITNTQFIKDAEKKALNPKMGSYLQLILQKLKRQRADVCAQSAVHVLKYGRSGSVWVVDGSKLFSLNIPKWNQYGVLESQLI